ncbi:MAG: hypothetical protein BGO10_04660 [Chlamydia sp. 32-24]|nr:MAG: hypothetical protein BGO10_04660 [Chlamydia sp. 32-24]
MIVTAPGTVNFKIIKDEEPFKTILSKSELSWEKFPLTLNEAQWQLLDPSNLFKTIMGDTFFLEAFEEDELKTPLLCAIMKEWKELQNHAINAIITSTEKDLQLIKMVINEKCLKILKNPKNEDIQNAYNNPQSIKNEKLKKKIKKFIKYQSCDFRIASLHQLKVLNDLRESNVKRVIQYQWQQTATKLNQLWETKVSHQGHIKELILLDKAYRLLFTKNQPLKIKGQELQTFLDKMEKFDKEPEVKEDPLKNCRTYDPIFE